MKMDYDPKDTSPVPRGEYEDRHERVIVGLRKIKIIFTVLVVATFALAGINGYLVNENSTRAGEARSLAAQNRTYQIEFNQAIVNSCERNGNPTRTAVNKIGNALIENYVTQQRQADAFAAGGVYAELFPNIDPDKLDRLLTQSAQRTAATVMDLETALAAISGSIDCDKLFPDPGNTPD